ncbi:peptide deformylase 1A, chloroplastic isoform X1 [Selaginella moellendorffii]|uniref:peptide deformylase 1A, chloroplastic isoform X1 n=1 Tax=Selaginella moellendorffii TaxID=88036 RepID=UPI000D1CE824|nr:peptide deformylase 1A, chloroplastic isoform X1 [Selaginella moellendorffii]|eukprot:XP_024544418.1 peptide deformylase 1A, chloroplastic isoform X1 [Selaginella moellendorffii]
MALAWSPATPLPTLRPPLRVHHCVRRAEVRRRFQCRSLFGFKSKAPKLEIVQAGDPVLHEAAREVLHSEVSSDTVQNTIQGLIDAMREAPAVGLAAPQIGVPLQIIVLEDTAEYISYVSRDEALSQQRKPFELLVSSCPILSLSSGAHISAQVIINPILRPTTSATARFFEGCLSVHGFRAMVERHLDVEVTGLDREGRPLKVEASGWQARILQHECDHLAGTLYVDKFIPRTFRSTKNLSMPMARSCPRPGLCSVEHASSTV